MAYRVRASEMTSAPSGRLCWGALLVEIASSFTGAPTPKSADLFATFSRQRSGRDASPSKPATKPLRDAVCCQLSDHPILHAAPSIQVGDSVRAPWTNHRLYQTAASFSAGNSRGASGQPRAGQNKDGSGLTLLTARA
jgi:hypothetical protein